MNWLSPPALALQPNVLPTDVGTAKRKRVEGAVDVEYYEAASKRVLPQFTAAENLLARSYKRGGFCGGTRMTFYADMADTATEMLTEFWENRRPDAPVVQFRSGDEQACFRRHEP